MIARRLLLGAPLLLSGCAAIGEWGYRARAVGGHLDLLSRARHISHWLVDPATPEPIKAQLQLALRLRHFASQQLALPDNPSYQRYAELPDPAAVVWNVVAAPAFGFQLRTWCFPVMGCVAYRGYWTRAEAESMASQLQREGWEVYRYGVPAYSTLGYSNWLGGDPLLPSFLRWGPAELARLIFHELAHQRAYAQDGTAFNENYASFVERQGLAQWWAAFPDAEAQARDAQAAQRRERWRQLALACKTELQALYSAGGSGLAEAKAARLTTLREAIAALARDDAGYAGYARWAAEANNAHLALLSTYSGQTERFAQLFAQQRGDWPAFHAEVARLAGLSRSQRAALGFD